MAKHFEWRYKEKHGGHPLRDRVDIKDMEKMGMIEDIDFKMDFERFFSTLSELEKRLLEYRHEGKSFVYIGETVHMDWRTVQRDIKGLKDKYKQFFSIR